MTELVIRNGVGGQVIAVGWLRKAILHLVGEVAGARSCQLCVHLVRDRRMTEINEAFLQHEGSTDVITFNHLSGPSTEEIYGELFVCYDEARRQARRFHTHWTGEVVRYIVHGILHLRGLDDATPGMRSEMKKWEDRWVRGLAKTFSFRDLGRPAAQAKRPRHSAQHCS